MGWFEEKERALGVGAHGPFLVVEELKKFNRLACPSCDWKFTFVATATKALCPHCGYRGPITRK